MLSFLQLFNSHRHGGFGNLLEGVRECIVCNDN